MSSIEQRAAAIAEQLAAVYALACALRDDVVPDDRRQCADLADRIFDATAEAHELAGEHSSAAVRAMLGVSSDS